MPLRFAVGRHPFVPIKAAILLGRPVPLIAPCLKVGLGAVGQEHAPRSFEVCARLVERRRGAVRRIFDTPERGLAGNALSPVVVTT